MEKQLEGWIDAIAATNRDGKRAHAKAHTQWLKAAKEARELGRPAPSQKEPTFTPQKEEIIWTVLKARIKGLTGICRDGNNGEDWFDRLGEEEPEKQWKWKTQDFYQGLTPKGFTDEWKTIFKTTATIARYMVGRFVSAVEEFGRTEIWNKRCKVTVEWERENGITSMSKRVRGRNCVGRHRPSRSGSIGSAFRQRPVVGVKDIRPEADDCI
ncbi:hypothetical protein BGX21_007055, partial [Mortierella sp. AD011]